MRDFPLVIPCGTLGGGGTGEINSPSTTAGENETCSGFGNSVGVGSAVSSTTGVGVGAGVSVGIGVEVGSGVGVNSGAEVGSGVEVGTGVGVGVGSGISSANTSGFLFLPISMLKTRIKHTANGSNTLIISHIK